MPASSRQSEVDAARLAHKRALDRKSQNAKRERTRVRIQTLEQQLAECETNLRDMARENARLEADNCRLRECVVASPPGTEVSMLHTEDGPEDGPSRIQSFTFSTMVVDPCPAAISGASTGPQPLAVAPQPLSVAQQHVSPSFGVLGQSSAFQEPPCRPTPHHLFQALPCNSVPTCLSDTIMETFIKSHSSTSPPYSRVERPNVLSLIMPESSIHISPILRVASDILRAFTDISTLPEQVAGLYLMFRLLNWRVYPTFERFNELPEWLRPIPVQLRVSHPAWMDAIPWPKVRAHIISRQSQYDFDTWSAFYSAGLTVSWPYNPCDTILAVSDEEVVASPVFEQHWQNLKNWNINTAFRRKFSEVGDLVDE